MQPISTPTIDIRKLITTTRNILNCVAVHNPNIAIRVFGSAAIAIRCPNYIYIWQNTNRKPVKDIDFVTLGKCREDVRKALSAGGFPEVEGSMATNAQYRRLYFYQADPRFLIEVHSAPFMFHHRIPFDGEFGPDSETLTLADLAVTKLQWADLHKNNTQSDFRRLQHERQRLADHAVEDRFRVSQLESELELCTENTAQLIDICILFAEHQMQNDGAGVGISIDRFLQLARRDWGLWVTLRRNLKTLERFAVKTFSEEAELRDLILSRIRILKTALATISDTTIKWNVDRVVRKVVCERCVPIGYPVEEPRRDIWQ